MAEQKIVRRELLADGIRLDGIKYRRGDEIELPEDHAKTLESHGSVAAVGTLAKRAKAQAEAQRVLADAERPDVATEPEPEPARRTGR